MDPNACWQRFLDACADDEEEARFAIEELAGWLRRGGFPPNGINPHTVYALDRWIVDAKSYRDSDINWTALSEEE
jgi:hypothetical protein